MNCAKTSKARAESGFVLIASLLLLLVLTFLAVGMYRSFRVQESMAANTKEKARAYQVAESTELYAEYLLTNDLSLLAQNANCSTTAHLTVTPATVCSGVGVKIQLPTSGTPMTLLNGQVYSTMTPSLNIEVNGGSSSAGGGTYYANPQFYIQYLGLSADGQGQIYQITALGYGGNANAVAVVQSIFQLTSGIKNLGGL
ncbi:MAG: pilus assembly PilX family protein [Rhodanobacter sp.]